MPNGLNVWRSLVVAFCASHVLSPAWADERAIQNAEFLARADSANARCSVLRGSDALDLTALAAAAAHTEETRIAARRGSETGAAVRCDEIAARGINGVLNSARSQGLSTKFETAPVTPDEKSQDEELSPSNEEPAASSVSLITPPQPAKKKPVQTAGAQLKRYEIMAAAYFKQLKCPTMSRRELVAFYENVIEAHRKSVAIYGSAKVSQTVRSAASRAKAGNC